MQASGGKHLTQFLRKRVDNYVNLFKYGPQQGTHDWVRSKKRTIGGSEMATIMGLNKYSSIQQLVAQKVGLQGFAGSVKTRWGNLFEPVIQTIVEWDLDTKIMGEEISIPGIVQNQSYSPDGIGVVETETTITWMEEAYNGLDSLGREGTTAKVQKQKTVIEPAIALFEFKCPFNRLPNGKIPEYYEPQVKTGLDTIRDNFGALCRMPVEADPELTSPPSLEESEPRDKSMCDYGIYIEAQFRKCTWEDLSGRNPNYDRELWPGDHLTPRFPLAYGFIGFYFNMHYKELFKVFDTTLIGALAESNANSNANNTSTTVEKANGTHSAGIAKLIAMAIGEMLLDDNVKELLPTISRDHIAFMFPGQIITVDGIRSLLMCYYELCIALRAEYIDITAFDTISRLSKLPKGSIHKYCELSDLGGASLPLLEILFEAFQNHIICPWTSPISYTAPPQHRSSTASYYPRLTPTEETEDHILSAVELFINYCADNEVDVVGLFPWKLLKLDYHRIEKEIGYVEKWKDKISETINIVNELNNTSDPRQKLLKFAEVFGSSL